MKYLVGFFVLLFPICGHTYYYSVKYVMSTTYHEWGYYGASEEEAFFECRQSIYNSCQDDEALGGFQNYMVLDRYASGCWSKRPDGWDSLVCLYLPGPEEPEIPDYRPRPNPDPPDPPPVKPKFPRLVKLDNSYVQKMPSQRTCGSVIDVNRKTVGESIPLAGVPFSLFYTTDYDTANLSNFRQELSMTLPTDQMRWIKLKVTRNGVTSISDLPIMGRILIPIEHSNVREDVLINEPEMVNVQIPYSIAFGESTFSGNLMSSDLTLGDGYNYNPKPWGLGGFTLDIHHHLDRPRERIFYGHGQVADVKPVAYQDPSLGGVWLVPVFDTNETYVFGSDGRHLQTRDFVTNHIKWRFVYNSDKTIQKVIDSNGGETSFVRSGNGRLQKIVAPFGQETTFSTNSYGRIWIISDPLSRRHYLDYSADSGLLISITYPSGRYTDFTYDSDGKFLKETHSNGGWKELSEIIYGNLRKVEVRTAEGVVSELSFNKDMSSETMSYTGGEASGERWAGSNSRNLSFAGTSIYTTYGVDPRFGNSVEVMTARNTSISDLNRRETMSYSYTTSDPAAGATYTKTKSLNGKVSQVSYFYNAKKLVATSPLGRISEIVFDGTGKILKAHQPGGLPLTYSYYNNGLLQTLSKGGLTYSFEYDLAGNLSRKINNATGQIEAYEYDGAGQLLKKKQPDLSEVSYEYSKDGSVSKITLPSNEVHIFERDAYDQIRSYLAPLWGSENRETLYLNDTDRRLKRMTLPSGKQVNYIYESGLNRLQFMSTTRGNYIFAYSYDDSSIPSQITTPDGIKTSSIRSGTLLTREYVDDSNEDNISTVYWGYNTDHLVSTIGVGGITIPIVYDNDSRISDIGGESYTYSESYDASAATAASRYESALGNIKSTYQTNDFLGGTTILTGIEPIANDEAAKKEISITKLHSGTTTMLEKFGTLERLTTYTYDQNSRLIGVSRAIGGQTPGVTASYEFYPNSNNIKWYRHGNKSTMGTYDSQDRIIQLSGAVSRTYQYDLDGNVATITNCYGTKSFEYDEFKNLRKVVLPNGKVVEYAIDGMNRRIAKKVNGSVVEYYAWYDQTRLAAVLEPDRSLRVMYVYGNHSAAPTYLVKQGQKYKIFTTPQGSIRAIYDVNGVAKQEIEYDEYGAVLSMTNPTFQPLGFNSGLHDIDTRLVRFGARDYDPEVGRWNSKDPILFDGGDANLYGYVINDPINFIDPNGLWSLSVSAYVVFGGGFTIGQNKDGSWFGTARAGIGKGGGISWDKHGEAPGGACKGVSMGVFAEAGVALGPFEVGVGSNSGYSQSGGPYATPLNPSGNLTTNPIKVGVGYSGGVEISFQ